MNHLETKNLIQRISTPEQAPASSYLVYDINGGIYFVLIQNYEQFANEYLKVMMGTKHHLTLDLNFAVTHSLVFDIDIVYSDVAAVNWYIANIATPTIRDLFDNLGCLTILYTKRVHGGIHIHLPEIEIANDDYEFMCYRLKPMLSTRVGPTEFVLDVPTNFNLALAAKPETSRYKPYSMVHIESLKTFSVMFVAEDIFDQDRAKLEEGPVIFRKKKLNEGTAFRFILTKPYAMVLQHVYSFMMPVPANSLIRTIPIGYTTLVSPEPKPDLVELATFGTVHNGKCIKQYLQKKKVLQLSRSTTAAKSLESGNSSRNIDPRSNSGNKNFDARSTFEYIQKNAAKITQFTSISHALARWWRRLEVRPSTTRQDIFRNVNDQLQRTNDAFLACESPLKVIMEYDRGCYFLPVFYALQKVVDAAMEEILIALRQLLNTDDEGYVNALLDKFAYIDPKVVMNAASSFTLQTIIYCGCNMQDSNNNNDSSSGGLSNDTINEKFEFIFSQNGTRLACCSDAGECEKLIISIMEQYFPIRGSSRHRFLWDCVYRRWRINVSTDDIKSLIVALNANLKQHWLAIKGTPYPLKETTTSFNCTIVQSVIGRKAPEMDQNKWFLNTDCGVLDLLTGYIGRAVPEHYLSGRSLELNVIRNLKNLSSSTRQMQAILDDTDLQALFAKLWSREFFETYVASLREDGDYFQNLKYLVMEHQLWTYSAEAEQMLHFYIHLCKFMRFHFEEMSFMMYVLASFLVATNYGKFIIIIQGEKNNGKSKFFEMIRKAMGTYASAISSNMLCSTEKRETVPDIALTAFNARVMIAEELGGSVNENFIKMLTGNSTLSVRTLYENSRVGIPTTKLVASTNQPPGCTATEAFCERVLPFHFGAKFVKDPPESLAQQLDKHVYEAKTDDDIVNGSVIGMFLHMYYLHISQYDRNDGFLHYPAIPESILQFKSDYLEITDIFKQFKTYADIQEIPREVTTVSQLQSAVRQFLTQTRRSKTIKDTDLIRRFELEYAAFRKEIDNYEELSSEDSSSDDGSSDEEEPASKKLKQAGPIATIVIYDGIAIKNLKQTRSNYGGM